MKNILMLVFILLLMSCSSSDDSGNEENPTNEQATEVQNENILNQKIENLETSLQFGVQSDALQSNLTNKGYSILSNGNILNITNEKIYGRYHMMFDVNGESKFPIQDYSFKVQEENISGNNSEPFVIQEFFYENNDDMDNKPYYQVQITFDKVNNNSYNSVKEWVLGLDGINNEFQSVSDLDFVSERITQTNIIVELGENDNQGSNNVIFVRFFENRIPIYAQ